MYWIMEEVMHIYGHTYVYLCKLICLNFHAFESKVTSICHFRVVS